MVAYVPPVGEEIKKPEATFHGEENSALTVERPLFEKGPNWDFKEFKKNLLAPATVEELADLHFFDGKDEGKNNFEHD